jgi:hypothetical protein
MTKLPELVELNKLEAFKSPFFSFDTLGVIQCAGSELPIRSVVLGSRDPSAPTLGLFGGVHGLERIGSQIIISFLNSLHQQLTWDKDLRKSFENFRIVSIPIVNPGGLVQSSRCNPNGVDLMRNAPVEATGKTYPLVSGHRYSPKLPWYRGQPGVLEKESQVLIDFVQKEMFSAPVSIALDVHSGFGMKDQIWYPYAKSKETFPLEKEALNLKGLLDRSYPKHIYKFEGQSDNYITHGDLWDYMYELHVNNKNTFLPLTLELGSWSWIRKNPLQFFSKVGLFHPVKEHRHARIMRRHILFLDLLARAVQNPEAWIG